MKTEAEWVEELAEIQHAIWAHWMKYMFEAGGDRYCDSWQMYREKEKRWLRQARTAYQEL